MDVDDAAGVVSAAENNPFLEQFGLQVGDCMFLSALRSLVNVNPARYATYTAAPTPEERKDCWESRLPHEWASWTPVTAVFFDRFCLG
jgi:hypothetical protein